VFVHNAEQLKHHFEQQFNIALAALLEHPEALAEYRRRVEDATEKGRRYMAKKSEFRCDCAVTSKEIAGAGQQATGLDRKPAGRSAHPRGGGAGVV
jgi:hypothetical protein